MSYIRFLIEAGIYWAQLQILGLSYPYQKPKLVKNLVHVHSISDISIYRKGSLDNYDSVILVNFKKIYKRTRKKQLNKDLLPLGVYLDHLIKRKKNSFSKSTILIASLGNKGCLRNYGIKFIKN